MGEWLLTLPILHRDVTYRPVNTSLPVTRKRTSCPRGFVRAEEQSLYTGRKTRKWELIGEMNAPQRKSKENAANETRKKSRGRILIRALAVLLAIAGCWTGYLLWKMERTIQEAVPRQADVAIILGAAVWGDRPSPGLRERLDGALELYREGYVPYLLVSGGLGEGKTSTEAAVMRNYLMEQGVPEEHILLEHRARDTYENLKFSREIMRENGLSRALVVSHDYHLARAIDIARRLEIDASPVGVTSHVLYGPFHIAREVLAFTKWHLSSLFL